MGYRDRTRAVTVALAALSGPLVVGLVGVTPAWGVTGAESAQSVVAAATSAMSSVSSFDVVIEEVPHHQLRFDLAVSRSGDVVETTTVRGVVVHARKVGGTLYVNTTTAGLQALGVTGADSKTYAGRWLSGSPAGSLAQSVGPFFKAPDILSALGVGNPGETYRDTGTSTVNGHPVVVIATSGGSVGSGTVDVASTGHPYVLEASFHYAGQGTLTGTFSGFGRPVTAQAPAGSVPFSNLKVAGKGTGAADRATQSDVTNAVISGKTIFTEDGTYPPASKLVGKLESIEPELQFTTQPATSGSSHVISVDVDSSGQILLLAGQSTDGRCWYTEDNEESRASAGGFPAAKVSSHQGISYAGSPSGTSEPSCPTAVAELPGYLTASSWKATFPS
ncbi:MAG TPA: hypothetical protein VK277_06595 [Acidimicrobiales bacterium]|nr:hypothetical protein [Acidimicrobiales bacterium]